MLKLDIGGGRFKRDEDFFAVDLYGQTDIRATMWKLPFPDNSVDLIWSSHTLEHAPMKQIPATLLECIGTIFVFQILFKY